LVDSQDHLELIKYNLSQTNYDKEIWLELSQLDAHHKIEISKDNDDNEIIFLKIITTKDKMDSIQSFLSEIDNESYFYKNKNRLNNCSGGFIYYKKF